MAQEEKLIELMKSKLPQWLREDEEFRALVLGTLIQYLPTREEIKLILERLERIEAELVELRQEQIALREDFNRMQQTIEAILERIERMERQQTTLVGHVESLGQEMRSGFKEIRTGLSRLGIVSEEVLRNTLQTAVEKWLGAGRVERMELGGREVDVVIRDSAHVILEITARAHLQDIDKLKVSAEDYEQRFNIKPRLAIACAYASPVVVQRLVQEGIELISAELPE